MKALILHDDSILASDAKAMLHRALTNGTAPVRWCVCSQPIGSLRDPLIADRVLAAATDAHLIVFAGRHTESLSLCVYHWLERWADSRHVPDAALALLEGEGDFNLANATPELSRFARKHQLAFITDETPILPVGARLFVRGSN